MKQDRERAPWGRAFKSAAFQEQIKSRGKGPGKAYACRTPQYFFAHAELGRKAGYKFFLSRFSIHMAKTAPGGLLTQHVRIRLASLRHVF